MQTALFAPRIRDLGYDVTLNCPMSMTMSPITWNGMVMFGAAGDPLGNDLMPMRARASTTSSSPCATCSACSRAPPSWVRQKWIHWLPDRHGTDGGTGHSDPQEHRGRPCGHEQVRVSSRSAGKGSSRCTCRTASTRTCSSRSPRRLTQRYREAFGISPDTFVIGMAAVNKPDSPQGH